MQLNASRLPMVANVDFFFVGGGGLFILSFLNVQKIHMPNPTLFMTHSGRVCLQKSAYIIIMVNTVCKTSSSVLHVRKLCIFMRMKFEVHCNY